MDVPKSYGKSISFMIAGLVVLLSSVGVSILAVYSLEEAYQQRKMAVEAQDSYDDLSKKIKDWVLISHVPMILGTDKDGEIRARLRSEVDVAVRKVLRHAISSPDQIRMVPKLALDVAELTNSKNFLNINALRRIDEDLEGLNAIERDRIDRNGNQVLAYIGRLTTASSLSIVFAILLIVFSLRAKNRDDSEKIDMIGKLNSLKEDAESASSLKSKFLSTVSHEIRTPLNGIIGISDIMIHSPPSLSDKSLARTINQSGKTLLRIINDILDFSKIEAGKIDLVEAEFSILDVLNQVMMTLSSRAAEKSINLNYEISPRIPLRLSGDAERLAQVLFNLVGNAIKFTQVGSVIVRVAPKITTTEMAEIEFSVSDSGIGLSGEDIENLFKPFVQVRKVGTSGEAGTGLGLSISQSIVHEMGGEIKVSSAPNRGSTFSFVIPFSKYSNELVETRPTFRAAHLHEAITNFEPLVRSYESKVLVVEDNPTNQIVAQSMLARLGVDSVLAANGEEALKTLANSQVDLILMDCQMPILDGFETTKLIRKGNDPVPILAMTANAFNADEEQCREAGMNDYIAKPVDVFLLREKLEKHLPMTRPFTSLPLIALDSTIGAERRKRVVRAFMSTIQNFRESVEQALANQNLEDLRRIGHRYKGSSQTVGGTEFTGFCQNLEMVSSMESALDISHKAVMSLSFLEKRLGQYT